MILRIPTASLKEHLQNLCSIIPMKKVVPAAGYMLINASNGEIKYTVNAMHMQLEYTQSDIDIEGDVTICVNASTFTSFLGNIKGYEVFLHIEDNQLVIAANRIIKRGVQAYKCALLPPNEFIKMKNVSRIHATRIQSSVFKDNIQKMPGFVTDDDFRAAYQNIWMTPRGDGVCMIATDGISVIRVDMEGIASKGVSMLTDIAPVCKKIIDSGRTSTEIIVGSSTMMIDTGNYRFMSVLSENQGFNEEFVNKILDNKGGSFIRFKKSDLEGIISRMRFVNKDQIEFSIKDGTISISATNEEYGNHGEEELIIDNVAVNNMERSFNPKIFQAGLRAIDDGIVTMYYNEEQKHIIIVGDNITVLQMAMLKL